MGNELSNFCYNIAFLRKKYGYSIEKMASILNIAVNELECIEKGFISDNVSCEVVFIIHKYFGILPQNLFAEQLY